MKLWICQSAMLGKHPEGFNMWHTSSRMNISPIMYEDSGGRKKQDASRWWCTEILTVQT